MSIKHVSVTFSETPLNTDTPLIRTIWLVPLVSVLTGFYCTRNRKIRYSVLELSIKMLRANLESAVWKRHVGAQLLGLQHGGQKSTKTSGIHFCYKKRSDHQREQVNIQINTSRKISTVQTVKIHKMKHFFKYTWKPSGGHLWSHVAWNSEI